MFTKNSVGSQSIIEIIDDDDITVDTSFYSPTEVAKKCALCMLKVSVLKHINMPTKFGMYD